MYNDHADKKSDMLTLDANRARVICCVIALKISSSIPMNSTSSGLKIISSFISLDLSIRNQQYSSFCCKKICAILKPIH